MRGSTKSCGCLLQDIANDRIEDLTGQIFGRLKVLYMLPHEPGDRVKWMCECMHDGNLVSVTAHNLKNGTTRSCGCLHKEIFYDIITKHGLSDHPLYSVWLGMNSRCNNPNDERYDCYGGRGIKICSEWRSFENFYNDMIEDYKPGLQIDRIDNNDGYYKENCHWVTAKENCRNTRRNVYLNTPYGAITAGELSEELDVPSNLIKSMIDNGHTVDDVMDRFSNWDGTYEKKDRTKLQTPFGPLNKTEFAKRIGMSRGFVCKHLAKGESIEEIIDKANEYLRRKDGRICKS